MYRIELVVPATGTPTGATYIVYQTGATNWVSKLVSANGTTSNHPLLRINPAGTVVEVYHNHPTGTYSIRAFVRSIQTGNTAGTAATIFGLDGHMTNLAGNIGIGTTTPTAKLEVAGQMKITGGIPGVGKVLTSDATGLASWSIESDPQIGTNTTNYLSKWDGSALVTSQLFDNGTNVGIGTSTPNTELEVVGSASTTIENIAGFFNPVV